MRKVKALAGGFEERGGRLDGISICAGEDADEAVVDTEFLQPSLHPAAGGGGGHGEADALPRAPVEKLCGAIHKPHALQVGLQHGLADRRFCIPVVLLAGELFEMGSGVPVGVAGAETGCIGGDGDFLTFACIQMHPGLVDGPLGINEHAIEIKDNALGTPHEPGIRVRA